MCWRTNVVQQNDISNSAAIPPDHMFQNVHTSSTISGITRRRRGCGIKALNICEESVTLKKAKNEADLYYFVP